MSGGEVFDLDKTSWPTPRFAVDGIVIENFRSIAHCDVRLDDLTYLVGPNGAGKSNVLDALRFVSDALRMGLDRAIRDRGGIGEILHRNSGETAQSFAIRLDFAERRHRLPRGRG